MRGVVQPRLRGRILARDRPFRGRRGVLFVPRMGLLVVLREVFGDRALDGGSQGRAAGVVADAGQRGQREGASSVGRFDGRGGASPDRWGRRGRGGLRGSVRFAAGVEGKDGWSARAWGAGGSGIRDEAFGSERARTCYPRHRRVVSCPCARRRCIPRPRPAPTSRRPRGEPSRDVLAILPTV